MASSKAQANLLGDHLVNSQRKMRSSVSVIEPILNLHLNGAMTDKSLLLESTQTAGPLRSKEDIILSTTSVISKYSISAVSRRLLSKWHAARQMSVDVIYLIVILNACNHRSCNEAAFADGEYEALDKELAKCVYTAE